MSSVVFDEHGFNDVPHIFTREEKSVGVECSDLEIFDERHIV